MDEDAHMEDPPSSDSGDHEGPSYTPARDEAAGALPTEVKDEQKNFKPCKCGEALTLAEQYNNFLICSKCSRVMHGSCTSIEPNQLPLPGDRTYTFVCNDCGAESLTRSNKSWLHTVHIALWNLEHEARQKHPSKAPPKFFRWREDICAYLDRHWERLCFGKVRTATWNNTIGSTLSTHPTMFESGASEFGTGYWGLAVSLPPWAVTDEQRRQARMEKRPSASQADDEKRSRRRAAPATADAPAAQTTTPRVDALASQPTLAAPPAVVEEGTHAALSAGLIKLWYYPNLDNKLRSVVLSREHSAPQIRFASELECSNAQGYRLARASHGVDRGTWFCEVELLVTSSASGGTEPHARVGWATAMAEPQAPVGYDSYSYGMRDNPPAIFHQARSRPYGEVCARGDVIGMLISIPEAPVGRSRSWSERVRELLTPYNPFAKRTPPTDADRCPGSRIAFFRNGRALGGAFENIFDGFYYPAASLYMGGAVRFNFGPKFKFPPMEEPSARPMSEVLEVLAVAREAQIREDKIRQQEEEKAKQRQQEEEKEKEKLRQEQAAQDSQPAPAPTEPTTSAPPGLGTPAEPPKAMTL